MAALGVLAGEVRWLRCRKWTLGGNLRCLRRAPAPRALAAVLLLFLLALLAGCGINTIPTLDEQVKAAWAQVQNQYQRRADLIPNLVETVKGLPAGAGGADRGDRGARQGRRRCSCRRTS